ncbi:ECF transporter S component [uncultured Oscillibacter sp.]|uniref:ECF transporter S component n=1 Tax=uncultured Oscillibacter sp. TaxID=876091 RepID=UPI0025D67AAC|nr:ECF transporter S component [uncultured Oscillibacter sp.]
MSEPNVNALAAPRARTNVKTITSLAMLTAIAYVVMVLCKALPQVSGFLQLEVKDTVICIGGFVFGPLAAAVISIVVATVEMFTVSDTGLIGWIMNVLATTAFCCTAAFVYKKAHTKKGAVVGLTLGVAALTAVMLLWNYLITPLYMSTGASVEDTREMVAAMLVPVFLPFNLVKGGLNMAMILLLYKPVVTALRKARLVPEAQGAAKADRTFNTGFLLFSLALLATFVVLALVLMGKL